MALEGRVLRVLAERCTFAVPRVIAETPAGDVSVRSLVAGLAEPWTMYARAKADQRLAAAIGRDLGALLAEQHTRVTARDAADWLPPAQEWAQPLETARERLPRVVADGALLREILATLDRFERVAVDEADRVLVHADLGLHNVVFDAATHAVRGVFYYEGAAWDDRHHDFRYLIFDFDDDSMLEAAIAAYEPRTGRRLSRERIVLYNAVAAASFLAFRDGVPPQEKSCGRTLDEDLRWMSAALARLSKSRSA
jgi:tetrahydromethanopterin S-methyltransferase subunit G